MKRILAQRAESLEFKTSRRSYGFFYCWPVFVFLPTFSCGDKIQ